MAIIYSYPKANSVQGSDLVVITRFDEEQNNQARTMSANIDSIKTYIGNNVLPTSNNYGLYAGTQNGLKIIDTNEKSLIPEGVGSLSVPADGFSVGDSFRGVLSGLLSSANNQTFKIKVYIDGILALNSGEQTISNISNDTFYLNLDFTVRSIGETGQIASVASFHYTKQSNGNVEGFSFSDVIEFDTTVENTLDVTFQWSSLNGSNAIQTKTFVLNKVY